MSRRKTESAYNVNQSFLDGGLIFQYISVIFYSAHILFYKQEGKNQVNVQLIYSNPGK